MDDLTIEHYVLITTTLASITAGMLGWLGSAIYKSFSQQEDIVVQRNLESLENFYWPLYITTIKFYKTKDSQYKSEMYEICMKNIGKSLPSKDVSSKLVKICCDEKDNENDIKELIFLVGMNCFQLTKDTRVLMGIRRNPKGFFERLCGFVKLNLCGSSKQKEFEEEMIKYHYNCLNNLGI